MANDKYQIQDDGCLREGRKRRNAIGESHMESFAWVCDVLFSFWNTWSKCGWMTKLDRAGVCVYSCFSYYFLYFLQPDAPCNTTVMILGNKQADRYVLQREPSAFTGCHPGRYPGRHRTRRKPLYSAMNAGQDTLAPPVALLIRMLLGQGWVGRPDGHLPLGILASGPLCWARLSKYFSDHTFEMWPS